MIRDTAIARTTGEPPTITTLTITPEPWTRHAACAEIDPDMWFPDTPQGGRISAAVKRTCAACPVNLQCAEFAIRTHQRHGVWAGMTARQLANKRRAS